MESRGIRNNNPLNIRYGSNWKGLNAKSKEIDSSFCVFKEPYWGFRAAFITLRTYYNVHKCRNLVQIIERWAPPSENATNNYIKVVCKLTGISPVQYLPPVTTSYTIWVDIVIAMAFVECGKLPNDYKRYALLGLSLI